jgi:cytochrome c biogenesis protein CcdA/thiol-disulfide isomerase/thioredoxin
MTASTRLYKYIPLILIISLLAVSGCIDNSQYQETTLNISTEKTVYHSNETLIVHVYFNSTKEEQAQLHVSGIKNQFSRPMMEETREVILKKGDNDFDLEFTTPSCEECSAVVPGAHYINATISIGKKTFESFTEITLEREVTNVTGEQSSNTSTTSTEVEQTAQVGTKKNGNTVLVEYFYDPACQKCAKAAPVIDSVIKSYGDNVSFSKYNILTDKGLSLATKYQLLGVPSVVINEQKLISYSDYEGNTTLLEEILKNSIEKASVSPAIAPVQKKIVLSVPSVFVVGFLAGFNPCLLAILAFIASVSLATTGRRRNVLLIVLMFSLGIFVTYLVVGIGLLNIIEQMPSLQTSIKNFLVILITVLGIWHLYDAWHLRKNTESSFYTPKSFIRLTESVTKNVSLPASFLIGALFSLIKAPCVGAVYFVILDMVRSGSGEGMMYLAAYNFGVVLPVLVLGFAIAFGLNPEKVEKFRKEKRSVMRLITGVTLLAIAVLMYSGII